jgi:hypothetical protein
MSKNRPAIGLFLIDDEGLARYDCRNNSRKIQE